MSRFFQFFSPFIHLLICPFDAFFSVDVVICYFATFTAAKQLPLCKCFIRNLLDYFVRLYAYGRVFFSSYFHRFSHSKFYAKVQSRCSSLFHMPAFGMHYTFYVSFLLKIYTTSLSPSLGLSVYRKYLYRKLGGKYLLVGKSNNVVFRRSLTTYNDIAALNCNFLSFIWKIE